MWLSRLLKNMHELPRLTAIYISSAAGEPMQSVEDVTAIVGKGLGSDRYAQTKGFWKSTDSCEVTLITQEEIDRASRHAAAAITQQLATGGHRRNLVIGGLSPGQLSGSRFAIGEVVFKYMRPRPPCGYLDRIAGNGMHKALGKHSGACIVIVSGGRLSVGDTVKIIR